MHVQCIVYSHISADAGGLMEQHIVSFNNTSSFLLYGPMWDKE